MKEENIDDIENRKPAKFFWLKNIFKTTSHKRLDAAIGPFELELRTLIANKKDDTPWAQRSIQMLQRARKALQLCEIELGWRYFFHAQLFSRHLLDSKSLRNRAQAILHEAEEKLSSWRKKTVQDYLGKNGVLKEEKLNVNDIIDAERILQEHYTNTYIKLSRALFQLEILVPIAFLLIVLSIWILMNFSRQLEINNPFLLLSIFVSGAIGVL